MRSDTAIPARRPKHLPARRTGELGAAAGELLLVTALFLAYKAGRIAATGRVTEATTNAETLWNLERLLHLPDEAALQHFLLDHHTLLLLANRYYAYVHFPAIALCLIWLYWRHRTHYRWTRTTLACLTAAGLVLHVLIPLAPPRLTPGNGLIDTLTRYGPSVYGPPDTDTLSNQYAAMPSLHVGWALVVAVALATVTGGRRRWIWFAHPLITGLVVVATGNHYWLDAIVAIALLVIILLVHPVSNPTTVPAHPRPLVHSQPITTPSRPETGTATRTTG
ncbi:hypothetical protein FB565_003067 [Actinoplanes lutulentus]|uniref:PAP2 superfamily protein n=1 Tax=Actinoplanes lutulentus TaxID=1287878 RepID=A0A327Z1J6_9ACTN|nr:phosphatase PAP2 family protein [Actinoplanes lutulentus]MBB2943354.1 hypothetical protein [Actinoplanes lutulentus]RAK28412.1 PAP2 superfamily protein [Actinoplanes lutulentus]